MTAKTRYRLLVAFSFLLGGAIVLPVACTSFVTFLEVLRAPVFLLSMFASVGLELTTVLSLGPARRRYQEEVQLERDKRQELPEPPTDLDDPDLVAAVAELNEFLPGSDLDIQEWKKEYTQPESPKSTTWSDLAKKGKTWDEVGCGGAGGSIDTSVAFGTYIPSTYNVQYKGMSIARPNRTLPVHDELDELRSYLAERQFSLNSWEADKERPGVLSYKFCVADDVTHKSYVLPVQVTNQLEFEISRNLPSVIVDEIRKTVDRLAAERLSKQLLVPAGLIEMSYKEDGSMAAYVDVAAMQKAAKRRRNLTGSNGPG